MDNKTIQKRIFLYSTISGIVSGITITYISTNVFFFIPTILGAIIMVMSFKLLNETHKQKKDFF